FAGSWNDLSALGQTLIENPELEQHAERVCRVVIDRLRKTLKAPRSNFLSEDYLVFTINELGLPLAADDLMAARGTDIENILREKKQPLSDEEKKKIPEGHLSYLADDLGTPPWKPAFVYATPAGAQAALEIMEYATPQLLKYRHYDQLLDDRL